MKFNTYICSGHFVLDINDQSTRDINKLTIFPECIVWCKEVFNKDVWNYFIPDSITLRFVFNREEDRNWFILRWS